jgi:hypothetical protein
MIHILWCTLRPKVFIQMHSEWIKRSKNPSEIKTYVAVNWSEHENELKDYLKNDFLVTLNTDRIGVCYPSYQLSSKLGIENGLCKDDDIVVFASDDFLAPFGWDEYLIEKLKGKGEVGLMVNDGYQAFDFSNMAEPVFSIPIMTYSCLRKLNGIIYHPSYYHLCSDAELYLNLKEMNLILDDRKNDLDFIFEHKHWSCGKRSADVNDQNYYGKFEVDKKNWEIRKNMTLEERLKV